MGTSTSRYRRSGLNPLLAFLLILVAVVGTVGTLHATGRIHIEALDRWIGREVQAQDDGKVGAPIASLNLKPGHRITRADIWDQTTGFYRFARLDPKVVEEAGVLRSPGDIEGRVLGRTKVGGKTFSEADFLPPGSQDGPMALVPDAMRGLTLDASKVRGLEKLRYKDRFDLIVSQKVDQELFDTAKRALKEQTGSQLEKQLQIEALKEMAEQRVLVRNGMLIEPAEGSGSRKENAIVALAPEEVMPLLEALDLGHTVVCVARTGKAGVEVAAALADQEPAVERLKWVWETVQEVEVIAGAERASVTVPKVTQSTQ